MPKRERRERREQRPRIIFAMIRYVHDGVDRDGAVLGYLFNILQHVFSPIKACLKGLFLLLCKGIGGLRGPVPRPAAVP